VKVDIIKTTNANMDQHEQMWSPIQELSRRDIGKSDDSYAPYSRLQSVMYPRSQPA
jgi:hypothetical protein